MNESIATAIKNWVPYRFFEEGGNNCCRWIYLGNEKISEPFFDDTVSMRRMLPENSKLFRVISNTEILPEWAMQVETVKPTAFIFHISRCGSTLVSQLLGLSTANLALSEVPLFDELLRWGHKNNAMPPALKLLKAAIALVASKPTDDCSNLFVKVDSWHVHFYKELRELYPRVPFILLYRRPDEVIRSQQKKRGMQAIPGLIEPEIFGFDKNQIHQQSFDEYMAKVIESYLQAFIKILEDDEFSMAVNYNEGAINIVKKITKYCGISIHEKEMELMNQRMGFHGKYPEQFFSEPPLNVPAPPYLDKAFELYHELEKIKNSKPVLL